MVTTLQSDCVKSRDYLLREEREEGSCVTILERSTRAWMIGGIFTVEKLRSTQFSLYKEVG